MWTFRNQSRRCVGEVRERVSDISIKRMTKRRNVTRIAGKRGRRTGCTMIFTRKANMTNGETGEERRNDRIEARETRMTIEEGIAVRTARERGTRGMKTAIGGEIAVKIDRREEIENMKTMIEGEIAAKTDRRERVKGISTARRSIGVATMTERDLQRRRMIPSTENDRISIKRNDENGRRIVKKQF